MASKISLLWSFGVALNYFWLQRFSSYGAIIEAEFSQDHHSFQHC